MEYLYAILPWVVIFGIFWFFLIRPQQKQKKEHKNMLDNLGIGDKVVTIGGIKGKIVKIRDNNVRLRVSSSVDIDFVKNAISRVKEKNTTGKTEYNVENKEKEKPNEIEKKDKDKE